MEYATRVLESITLLLKTHLPGFQMIYEEDQQCSVGDRLKDPAEV